jgi:hypothetical protein
VHFCHIAGGSRRPDVRKENSMAKQPLMAADSGNNQWQNMTAFSQLALDMFTRGYQSWSEGAAVVNREVMSFVGGRLRDDAAFAEKFAKCENWSQASKLQQEWIMHATEAYAAESGRLVEVATKVTTEGLTPLRQSAEEMMAAMTPPASE